MTSLLTDLMIYMKLQLFSETIFRFCSKTIFKYCTNLVDLHYFNFQSCRGYPGHPEQTKVYIGMLADCTTLARGGSNDQAPKDQGEQGDKGPADQGARTSNGRKGRGPGIDQRRRANEGTESKVLFVKQDTRPNSTTL